MSRPETVRALLAGLCALLGAGCTEPPRHLVVVSVDTLRADRLGAYGSALGLTPHLDALAAESVVFDNAWAPAPFTLASVAALLTGRHPAALGIATNAARLDEAVPTLAELLWSRGWSTGAVVSNVVLSARSGIGRGFQTFRDCCDDRPERRADATTELALALLDELRERRDAPLLLWVHYQDPHGPYAPPEGGTAPAGPPPAGTRDGAVPLSPDNRGLGGIPRYQALGDERRAEVYRARYHGEIRLTDAAVGALLEGLAARGLADRSLLLFTADHGESLGENDHWFAHGQFLTASETRIPLLLRVPGRRPERHAELASLLDVVPTALARLGVAAPPGLAGRDLLSRGAVGAEPVLYQSNLQMGAVPRRALLRGGYRLDAVGAPGALRVSARPIDAPMDAGASPPPEVLERLGRALDEQARRHRGPERPPERSLGSAERAQLRALGYLPDP